MRYNLLVIRYGELALKASYTRRRFESILRRNISVAFNMEGIPYIIRSEWGRIYIETDYIEKSIQILKKIFGITSFSPAIKTNAVINDISKLAVELADDIITKDEKFALRVTRTGKHDFSSQDISVYVGEEIRNNTKASVDLTNPDIEIFIEIRDKYAYIFTEKILGPGGLPLGSQGVILAYIDTPYALLATWYIMKRGCKTIFYSVDTREMVEKFVKQWYIPSPDIVNGKHLIEKLNEIIEEKKCFAIITSHSLYNNPIDTIKDIQKWKENIKLPILSPLLTLTQKEIEEKYNKLGL